MVRVVLTDTDVMYADNSWHIYSLVGNNTNISMIIVKSKVLFNVKNAANYVIIIQSTNLVVQTAMFYVGKFEI